jgi:hypothetical protein
MQYVFIGTSHTTHHYNDEMQLNRLKIVLIA